MKRSTRTADQIRRELLRPSEEDRVCSICKEPYAGWGNNAWPVNNGRCCNDCNWIAVIPARLRDMHLQEDLRAHKLRREKRK